MVEIAADPTHPRYQSLLMRHRLEEAEKKGLLKPGDTIIETTTDHNLTGITRFFFGATEYRLSYRAPSSSAGGLVCFT